MTQQYPFPLVWEVEKEGVVSHIVGTQHTEPGEHYIDSIHHYLENKEHLLLEYILKNDLARRIARHFLQYPEGFLDERIQREARKKRLPVLPLATFAEQCKALVVITASSALHPLNIPAYYDDAYQAGDIETCQDICDIIDKSTHALPNWFPRDERNTSMTKRSLKHLKKPSLIAVGYHHLLGENNMLDLYKKQGFTVERI